MSEPLSYRSEEFLSLRRERLTAREIAERLSITKSQADRWLAKAHKESLIPETRLKPKASEEPGWRSPVFLSLRRAGHTDREIGDELGLTSSTIQRWGTMAFSEGLIEPRPRRGPNFTTMNDADIKEMVAKGFSATVIGERLGFTAKQIRNRIAYLGVSISNRTRRFLRFESRPDPAQRIEPPKRDHDNDEVPDHAVPFVQHTGCRWPYRRDGKWFCCNRERRSQSYCEGHAKIATVPSVRAA